MEENGVWRTVGGRRIFIKDGEDLETAMKNSGKFKKNEIKNKKDDKKAKTKLTDEEKEEKIKKLQEEINNSKRITNTKIVEEIKKIIDDYNSNGKRIDLEEFDFEEMTQLILKIHK